MSARTLLATIVGSIWYSTWATSGGLPALAAVSSLVASSSPDDCFEKTTLILGCARFQTSTILSMLGTQLQKLSVTGPACVEAFELGFELPEHPAASVVTSTVVTVNARFLARTDSSRGGGGGARGGATPPGGVGVCL